ncbi:MAG: MFS transporter, partial [Deltaproteobacteria bacterium]|nr:MFS transporter [Deltaproteobacteria bacterium]
AIGIRYSFGVYYIAILEEYAWGRAETAGAFSLAMISHAIFAPVSGTLVDRFGPRMLFPMGGCLVFFGLLAASRINTIWHLYLYFGVVMSIGINTMSYSPQMAIIPKWFVRQSGLASGLVLSGVGLGILLMLPFNELMIETVGWRIAFLIQAGIVIFILVPVNALFQRRSPEDVGQYPDGIIIQNDGAPFSESGPPPDNEKLWTLKDAFKVRAFWCIVFASACDSFVINMLVVHQAVHIVDLGFSEMLAATLLGLVGILGSVGGILCGFLSDRIGREAGYTLGSVLVFAGIFIFLLIKDTTSPWMLYAFVTLYGLGNGGKSPMVAALTGDFFPGNSIGRILSIQSIGFGIGGALGAYTGGYFHDHTGSYFVPFVLLLTSTCLGVLVIWLAAPHRWRPSRKEMFVSPGEE